MLILIFRTFILYLSATFIVRMMGKRQIGELQPFELVITIMVSELATLPMQDERIPLINGIIPMITLLLIQIIFSIIQLKSVRLRTLLSGKPSILINDGKIDISELKYQRLNTNDLMEELRLKGYFNLSDIKYAILETSGELSIIPKTSHTTVTKKDLGIKIKQEMLPITLISDGHLFKNNLKVANKDMTWLQNELSKNNVKIEDIFIGVLDSRGKFYYQLFKNGCEEE